MNTDEAKIAAFEAMTVFGRLAFEHGCVFRVEPMEPLDWKVPNPESGGYTGEVRHYRRVLLSLEFPQHLVSECAKVGHVVNVSEPNEVTFALPDGGTHTMTMCEDQLETFSYMFLRGLLHLHQVLCWHVVNAKVALPEETCGVTERMRSLYGNMHLTN